MKKALISGISGMDGSLLAELLLDKGYEVHGLVRPGATPRTQNIQHLIEPEMKIHLTYGDLIDSRSLRSVLERVQPDEVYNLAAQAHVRVSFDLPEYTAETTGVGCLRLLEAIREIKLPCRFYQASSSELFGKVVETPQTEKTPFYPRSPYAAAKAFAYYTTVNYREAYGIFAVNGILFNHECVPSRTPVVIRKNGIVDIIDIDEIVPHRTGLKSGRRFSSDGGGLEVWDGTDWAACTARTATFHDEEIVVVHGRGGIYAATEDHVGFAADGIEQKTGDVVEGDTLWLADNFETPEFNSMTEFEAWMLGAMVADGYVDVEGKHIRVTKTNTDFLNEVAEAWKQTTCGATSLGMGSCAFREAGVPVVNLAGNSEYARLLRKELYTEYGDKKIPKRIINASKEIKLAFLRGYNDGDGLKAGNRTDEFKSFSTSSPILAAGLVWLAKTVLEREHVSLYRQATNYEHDRYLINPSHPGSLKGRHLRKPLDQVRKVIRENYRGWMFDLATTSGRFAVGPGLVVIHNSPRRSQHYVTRKVTLSVAQICAGLQKELRLGNLDAKRDWGWAPEFCDGMWRMLQCDDPDDYVLATGEAHSVRELVELAFNHVGLHWREFVRFDERFVRPTEVDLLLGDASKAKRLLGWEPKTTFEQIVKNMVDADLKTFGLKAEDLRKKYK